eukprot:gnl/TRDRNA2_/TRDRNA2_92163_c0_seq1.p1 gnl/TRDRNA2_/TRDRNA2_92163_c0~~gnl/TRDRNA2_/TRDRNA2_92163_c0_seq1.p1  ORF type:complete len:210 (-),score=31.94 gnl/TRDRNA2_/TRDRNA2_92163_c0_seq1:234-863(-)
MTGIPTMMLLAVMPVHPMASKLPPCNKVLAELPATVQDLDNMALGKELPAKAWDALAELEAKKAARKTAQPWAGVSAFAAAYAVTNSDTRNSTSKWGIFHYQSSLLAARVAVAAAAAGAARAALAAAHAHAATRVAALRSGGVSISISNSSSSSLLSEIADTPRSLAFRAAASGPVTIFVFAIAVLGSAVSVALRYENVFSSEYPLLAV